MKFNRSDSKNLSPVLNLIVSSSVDFIRPLKPITPAADINRSVSLYSKKGIIQGIASLERIKGLKYGFSPKSFGNMAFKYGEIEEVVKNRANFIKTFGGRLTETVFMRPNHGTLIEVVDSSHKGRGAFLPGTSVGPADAFITFEKGVPLALNSADCVPLIITTKDAKVLALVHAGRSGTNSRIAKLTVKRLASLGIKPEELIVGIGPSIQKYCYKLDYLQTRKPQQWLPWVSPVSKTSKVTITKEDSENFKLQAEEGKIFLDIVGLNIQQLIDSGVNPDNIEVAPICALCLAKKRGIFSHFLSSQYTDSNLYPEGRFMAIAQLK